MRVGSSASARASLGRLALKLTAAEARPSGQLPIITRTAGRVSAGHFPVISWRPTPAARSLDDPHLLEVDPRHGRLPLDGGLLDRVDGRHPVDYAAEHGVLAVERAGVAGNDEEGGGRARGV